MTGQAADNRSLAGQRVALRGRLAWMTRAEALTLIRDHGGEWVAAITPQTSLLVTGEARGPLRKDGRPSRWLHKARNLVHCGTLTVQTENEFLTRLGMESPAGTQRLTTEQLSQVLGVAAQKVRTWLRLGLVQPVETRLGVPYFDFGQARWAKTLCDLARAGVSPERIRKSLQQLKRWLPDSDQPLSQLAVLERDGKLLVRGKQGLLAEPSGQAVLDFGSESGPESVTFVAGPQTAEEWFEIGCKREDAGQLAQAADAYGQALTLGGPDAPTFFNLGNVLHAQGHREQAAEQFRRAVAEDPAFVAAWNNLGVVLTDLGEPEQGLAALRRAVELDPCYADAHYNLADALDLMGRPSEAVPHWRAYLRFEPMGRWGDYARWKVKQAGGHPTDASGRH